MNAETVLRIKPALTEYLPEKTWHQDRQRCREAGIPDEVVYRTKWQIGLGQVRRGRV